MIKLDDVRERDFRENPEIKSEYEKLRAAYHLIGKLILARTAAQLSQEQVADQIGTKASVISRMESLDQMPSLAFAARYASAVGAELVVTKRERADPQDCK